MTYAKSVQQATIAVQATPKGYEVKQVAFQQWQVIKDGQVVATEERQRYAVDRAWRHSKGQAI